MPKNRDCFDPNFFLKRIFGEDHKLEVMDSNKLPDNWEHIISKSNPKSHYRWEKLNDDLIAHEDGNDQINEDESEDCNINESGESADDLTFEQDILHSDGNSPEPPLPASRKLPKRILAYSSNKLLNLFSRCKRGSVDGTFKSSCKMWKQQFIIMLKHNKHWIPVVWGWLPVKMETSYNVIQFILKVFFHLVLERLRELEIPFNLEELVSDFELNIHKAIDEILPEVDVLGWFFHLAKAFKKKVDNKEMKRHYENNPEFQKFIKQAIGLSSLPLGDLPAYMTICLLSLIYNWRLTIAEHFKWSRFLIFFQKVIYIF